MDNNNTDKINEEMVYKRYKKNHSIGMIVSLIAIVCTYIFFFSSPTIFHKASVSEFTPINEIQTLNSDVKFTISEWKYSKNQKLMEVQLTVANSSIKENDTYNYTAYCNHLEANKGRERLKVTTEIEEINYVVLWIYDVPDDFNSCVLMVSIPNENISPLSLFTNHNKVTTVDEINRQTFAEYRIEKINQSITSLKGDISENNKKIESLKSEIDIAKEYIRKLQEAEIFQSKNEIEESENQIKKYNSLIASKENNIVSLQEDNADCDSQIKEYENLIQKIKNSSTENIGVTESVSKSE